MTGTKMVKKTQISYNIAGEQRYMSTPLEGAGTVTAPADPKRLNYCADLITQVYSSKIS